MKTRVKAIIFDLDGILVEMPNVHYEILNKVFSLFEEQIGWEEHIQETLGLW